MKLFTPKNEQGVVLLFGQVTVRSNIEVVTVQAEFPDAEIVYKDNLYRVEFEFKSRSFWSHGHDYRGCDLVVCWEHDDDLGPMPVVELSHRHWRNKFKRAVFPTFDEKERFLATRHAEAIVKPMQRKAPVREPISVDDDKDARAMRIIRAAVGEPAFRNIKLLRLKWPADTFLVETPSGEDVLCMPCIRDRQAFEEVLYEDDDYIDGGVCVTCVKLHDAQQQRIALEAFKKEQQLAEVYLELEN